MKYKTEPKEIFKEVIAKLDLIIEFVTKSTERRINFLKTYGKTTSCVKAS